MRGVCEEPDVQVAIDDACLRWPRAEEAWDAIKWILARDPQVGVAVTPSGLSRVLEWAGARSISMPTIWALYVIEPDMVVVREVRVKESPYAYAGTA